MRRKERHITDKPTLESMIRASFHVTVGLPAGEAPYLLPMNFGYADGVVYLHSARAGRKVEMLQKAGGRLPASLLFVSKAALIDKGAEDACDLSTRYASVMATGVLEEVTDEDERKKGMRCMLEQVGLAERGFPDKGFAPVFMMRVKITEMNGKLNDPAA